MLSYLHVITSKGAHGFAQSITMHPKVAKKVNTLHIREVVGSSPSAPTKRATKPVALFVIIS